MCISIHVNIYIHIYIYTYIYVYIQRSYLPGSKDLPHEEQHCQVNKECVCVYASMYLSIYLSIYLYLYLYVCASIYIYIYTYICIYSTCIPARVERPATRRTTLPSK